MKKWISKDSNGEKKGKINASKSIKKNKKRLGGGGLSLEVFANAKSKSENYNPSLIKKQREFYKNAKYVSKYKKSLKQQSGPENCNSTATKPLEDGNRTGNAKRMNNKNSLNSLREMYEKKHEEEEKARIESEALVRAKKDERERAEARRKDLKGKMFKKTRSGQPVMKYRIEHLLQSIQGSAK
ncbi:hypothetical protein HHK36_012489 [Tetracentron sinense]|uniref:rRNA-processing protein FYV7 n=1 Tax=Tetracentron sinense TaxID=13715 RepID=A0A834Z8G7_TETSI|nr:hypothetical protein HHK36_012489 [Tetracentron sinense]